MKVPSFLLELEKDKQQEIIEWLRETQFPEYKLEEAIRRLTDPKFNEDTPLFYRRCNYCIFLKNYGGASLYYCTSYQDVIVQLGPNDATQILSGLNNPDQHLVKKAFEIAKERGFKCL